MCHMGSQLKDSLVECMVCASVCVCARAVLVRGEGTTRAVGSF